MSIADLTSEDLAIWCNSSEVIQNAMDAESLSGYDDDAIIMKILSKPDTNPVSRKLFREGVLGGLPNE